MNATAWFIGILGFMISQLLIFIPFENKGKTISEFIKKYYAETILAAISFIVLMLIFSDGQINNWFIQLVKSWKNIPDRLILYLSSLFIGMMNVGIIKLARAIFKALINWIKKYIIDKIQGKTKNVKK